MIKVYQIELPNENEKNAFRSGEVVNVTQATATFLPNEKFETEEQLLARLQSRVAHCAKDVSVFFAETLLYKDRTNLLERFHIAEAEENVINWKFWRYIASSGRHSNNDLALCCLAIEIQEVQEPDKEYKKKQEKENRLVGFELEITGIDRYGAENSLDCDSDLKHIFEFGEDCSIDSKGSCNGTRYEMEECPECGYEHEVEIDDDEDSNGTSELRTMGGNPLSMFLKDRHQIIRDIINIVEDNGIHGGAESSEYYTCGLHVHVKADKEELPYIAKYAMKHEDEAFELYEPGGERASYCKKYGYYQPEPTIDYVIGSADRYSWLNIAQSWRHSRPTVEFRIFNGTLDPDEIAKRIKWAHDFICKAVREGKYEEETLEKYYEENPDKRPFVYGKEKVQWDEPTGWDKNLYPICEIYNTERIESPNGIVYTLGEKITTEFNKEAINAINKHVGSKTIRQVSEKIYNTKENGGNRIVFEEHYVTGGSKVFKVTGEDQYYIGIWYNEKPRIRTNIVELFKVRKYTDEYPITGDLGWDLINEDMNKDATVVMLEPKKTLIEMKIADMEDYVIAGNPIRITIKNPKILSTDYENQTVGNYDGFILVGKDNQMYVAYQTKTWVEKPHTSTLTLPEIENKEKGIEKGYRSRLLFRRMNITDEIIENRRICTEKDTTEIWTETGRDNIIEWLRQHKHAITRVYSDLAMKEDDYSLKAMSREYGDVITYVIDGDVFAIQWDFMSSLNDKDRETYDENINYTEVLEGIFNKKYSDKIRPETKLISILINHANRNGVVEYKLSPLEGRLEFYYKSIQELTYEQKENGYGYLKMEIIGAGSSFYTVLPNGQKCWQNLNPFAKWIFCGNNGLFLVMEVPVIDGKTWNPIQDANDLFEKKVQTYPLKRDTDNCRFEIGRKGKLLTISEKDNIYNMNKELDLDVIDDYCSQRNFRAGKMIDGLFYNMTVKNNETAYIIDGRKNEKKKYILTVQETVMKKNVAVWTQEESLVTM